MILRNISACDCEVRPKERCERRSRATYEIYFWKIGNIFISNLRNIFLNLKKYTYVEKQQCNRPKERCEGRSSAAYEMCYFYLWKYNHLNYIHYRHAFTLGNIFIWIDNLLGKGSKTPGTETFRWRGTPPQAPGPPRTRFFRKVSGNKLTEKGGTPPAPLAEFFRNWGFWTLP